MAETVTPFAAKAAEPCLRLATRVARRLLYRCTYRMRGGLARGYRRQFGYGSLPRLQLTAEERFLDALDLSGKTVYDVGAYVGVYALFFAGKCGAPERVVCFEPNPETFAQLCANLDLNGLHALPRFQVAAGAVEGMLDLEVDPAFPARSTLDPRGAVMRTRAPGGRRHQVRVVRLDDLVAEAALPLPDFVKLDVEGFESEALRGMQALLDDPAPTLFVELHGRRQAGDVVDVLSRHGYRVFHVESASWLAPGQRPVLELGHLYCQRGDAVG